MTSDRCAGRRYWVQAGVVAAGLGAAMLGGAAVASAAPGDDAGNAASVSSAHSARTAARPSHAGPTPTASRRAAAAAAVSGAPAQNATRTPPSTGSSARVTLSIPDQAAQQQASSTAGFIGPVRAAITAAQAYIYGYPLMEYERVRQTVTALNTIYSLTSFANPDVNPIWKAIGGGKRPNTDTFYSLAELDLSAGPVVLSIPDMGNRYFSFQLTDPYTNVVNYIGSRTTGAGPGTYAIVWSDGPQGTIPVGAQVVEVPYSSILMLGRTLAGDAADQQKAIELIGQYSLTPTGGTPPAGPQPKPGLDYLDAISAAMAANPPPARDAGELATLARIGVGPGLTVAGAGLGPLARLAADLAVKATAALLPALANLTQLVSAVQHHGWAIPDSAIGNFGTDYVLRAGVAQVGLIANTPDEAMYSSALLDSRLLPLNGCSSYTLHFAPGQAPPSDAFWSVTVYDGDGNLVPNSENRYSVSSSRPDELVTRPDGSIDIIFSRTDPGDPTANWLPIPAGSFGVYLRNYVPQQAALDGSWTPPGIQRR
ncbi:DUF1254 domain-containing protein [Mycobacterium sp. DL592]|uniref:DUF1254 domain-containing protein n=1 Tax=Mycobacterium sp. DL592 TaxID=2675524 RepID=UPI00141F796D|nr:DUF1254 domain-containing protein [Mycobacterium sp. DL592]